MKTIIPLIMGLALFISPHTSSQTFHDPVENETVGEFPSQWDLVKGTAEVAILDDDKVIQLGNSAIITPLEKVNLGSSFTIEFDAYFTYPKRNTLYQYYKVRLWPGKSSGKTNIGEAVITNGAFKIFRHGVSQDNVIKEAGRRQTEEFVNNIDALNSSEPTWRHIKLEYDPASLKLFIDSQLVINVPRPKLHPTSFSVEGYSNQGVADINAIREVVIKTED